MSDLEQEIHFDRLFSKALAYEREYSQSEKYFDMVNEFVEKANELYEEKKEPLEIMNALHDAFAHYASYAIHNHALDGYELQSWLPKINHLITCSTARKITHHVKERSYVLKRNANVNKHWTKEFSITKLKSALGFDFSSATNRLLEALKGQRLPQHINLRKINNHWLLSEPFTVLQYDYCDSTRFTIKEDSLAGVYQLSKEISESFQDNIVCFAKHTNFPDRSLALGINAQNRMCMYGHPNDENLIVLFDDANDGIDYILNQSSSEYKSLLDKIVDSGNCYVCDSECVDDPHSYKRLILDILDNISDVEVNMEAFYASDIVEKDSIDYFQIKMTLTDHNLKAQTAEFKLTTNSGWVDVNISQHLTALLEKLGLTDKRLVTVYDSNWGQELGFAYVDADEFNELMRKGYIAAGKNT